MLNPLEYYARLCQPMPVSEVTEIHVQEKAVSFFCLWGSLAGLYSFIKWYKNDVPELYLAGLVLIIGGPIAVALIKYRIVPPFITANFVIACMAIFCGTVIYQLGAIHSTHIFWTIGIIIFAYLLTDSKSGLFWSVLVFLFTAGLIIGDRSGFAFPVHELDEKQTLINDYSGYLLPVLLLWAAQAYSLNIRTNALREAHEALDEARDAKQKSEVMSNDLGLILSQAGITAKELLSASEQLNHTISNMSSQSQSISTAVEHQANAAVQINKTLVNMADSVNQSNEIMSSITTQTNGAESDVSRSAASMNQAIEFMKQIRESNKGILGIMSVISDIAAQTNLLALNASIEAARAGDQGRGFAVVADEVRSLSQKSNSSAVQIKELLDQAASDVSEGTQLVNQAGDVLTLVVSSVQEIAKQTTDVNTMMTQQKTDIEGVVDFSNEVSEISRRNTESSQELSKGSGELSEMAEKLSSLAHAMHKLVNK